MAGSTSTRKYLIAAGLAVLAIAAMGFGGYYVWLGTPPPLPATMPEALDLLASSRFERLPDERKAGYIEKIGELRRQMSEEERQAMRQRLEEEPALRDAMRSAGEAWMFQQAKAFAQAEPAARQQLLDQFIDMTEVMGRLGGGQRGPGGGSGPPPGGGSAGAGGSGGPSQDRMSRMQMRLEHGDPQKQAYVGEFFKAMRLRRVERGLDPLPARPPRRN